jgi:hypothetical protein
VPPQLGSTICFAGSHPFGELGLIDEASPEDIRVFRTSLRGVAKTDGADKARFE